MASSQENRRQKNKRNVPMALLTFQRPFKQTTIVGRITDSQVKVISWSSAGASAFQGRCKHPFRWRTTPQKPLGRRALDQGMRQDRSAGQGPRLRRE